MPLLQHSSDLLLNIVPTDINISSCASNLGVINLQTVMNPPLGRRKPNVTQLKGNLKETPGLENHKEHLLIQIRVYTGG